MKRKIIIVLGPTGSGKSELALQLARKFKGFLISADSRQVYKGLDIGTNKDPGQWVNDRYKVGEIEEYLVDFVAPNQVFTLADWLKQTKEVLDNNPDRWAIIVGGTGLYISALMDNYQLPAQNLKWRKKVEKILQSKGPAILLEKIKKFEPDIEKKIDINNSRRVARAAEIILSTKKPLQPQISAPEYDFLVLGLKMARRELFSRLDQRMEEQMQRGLVEETKKLMERYGREWPAASSIGYKQTLRQLAGEIKPEEALRLSQRDSRRYAKRQMTWFRRDKRIQWVETFEQAEKLVRGFVNF